MDFKFIVAADVHLDSPLTGLSRYEGAPVDILRGATREALENLVTFGLEEEVAFVLFSGDLYDGEWKDYNTGLFLVRQLTRLREAGIKAYILYGNHDAESRITRSLRLPDNVSVFSTKKPETFLLEKLGVAIHGRGFARRDEMENLAERYPEALSDFFNIGMLHTALTGTEGHEPYAPCSIGILQGKGYDVWALGHVHARKVLGEDPLILYPGNTQGRHARETGPKGCTLVTVEDGEVASHVFQDLNVVRWEVITVDGLGLASATDIVDAVTAAVESAMGQGGGEILAARIRVEGACRAHQELAANPEKWTAEIRATAAAATGEGVWIEEVRFKTAPEVDWTRLKSGTEPLADLIRYIDGLKTNEEVKNWVEGDLKVLKGKLPPEIFQDGGVIDPGSGEALKDVLEEVKGMLVHRILETESRK